MPGPNVVVPIQDKSIWIFPLSKVAEAESLLSPLAFSPFPSSFSPAYFLAFSYTFSLFFPLLARASSYPPRFISLVTFNFRVNGETITHLFLRISSPYWHRSVDHSKILFLGDKLIRATVSLFLSRVDSPLSFRYYTPLKLISSEFI